MKLSRTLLIIFTGILIAVCWLLALRPQKTEKQILQDKYDSAYEKAEAYMQDKLYQQAIASYEEAMAAVADEEALDRLLIAYDFRFAEVKEDSDTYDEYIASLKKAIALFPGRNDVLEKLTNKLTDNEQYTTAYTIAAAAVKGGNDSDEAKEILLKCRYNYRSSDADAGEVLSSGYDTTVAKNSNGIVAYSASGSMVKLKDVTGDVNFLKIIAKDGTHIYDAVFSSVGEGEDEVTVVKQDITWLVNGEGIVLGKFPTGLEGASAIGEDLIALTYDGVTKYYNVNGTEPEDFGEYAKASAFQNKTALVSKDGKNWVKISNKGEELGELDYTDVVLSDAGEYLNSGVIIVTDGSKFKLLDKDFKELDFEADYMEAVSGQEFIAFKKNDKWGFVNLKGEVICEAKYEAAKNGINGLAAVCENGKWGFVNADMDMAIAPQFKQAYYFSSEGSCVVETDEGLVVITRHVKEETK